MGGEDLPKGEEQDAERRLKTDPAASGSAEGTELQQLREENARLKALLTEHGIQWEEPTPATAPMPETPATTILHLSTTEKVALFRRLFRGRADVYPLRWESARGKSGYSPSCGNEWKPGVCNKPRIKCGDCDHRLLLPVTDQVIFNHLAGQHTVGVYPLLADDTCCFLAADFDKADWREDARAIKKAVNIHETKTKLSTMFSVLKRTGQVSPCMLEPGVSRGQADLRRGRAVLAGVPLAWERTGADELSDFDVRHTTISETNRVDCCRLWC